MTSAGSLPKISLKKRLIQFTAVMVILFAGLVGWFVTAQHASILPDRFNMGHHHSVDYGGGVEVAHGTHHDHTMSPALESTSMISVTDLTGPRTGEPDRRFTLTARKTEITLDSGETIEAWGFNGQVPGPELRVRQGDLVEVTLLNELPDVNVTIHWHGVNVPNAEDGVAGVTQDAVTAGESHTYRFVAEDAGTYWYHSHQHSSIHVQKGLYGAFIVEPKLVEDPPQMMEMTLLSHIWETNRGWLTTLGISNQMKREAVAPGTPVRIRLINTSNYTQYFTLSGTSFKVTAIDGVDLNEPTDLRDTRLPLAAGVTWSISPCPGRLCSLVWKGMSGRGKK